MASSTPITVNLRPCPNQTLRVLELHADYTCADSGFCCEEPWGVPLLPGEAAPIEQAFNVSGGLEEFQRSVVHEDRAGQAESQRLATGDCGCIFHGARGADSFCTLQRRHGHDVLPTICQSFPRMAVRTPSGIFMTLTHACPTAAKLLLKENALAETTPRTVHRPGMHLGGSIFSDATIPPRFSAACTPNWEAFDYFWRWAPEWISNKTLTPGQSLYGLGLIVGHIESLGAQAAQSSILIDVLDQIATGFPAQLTTLCAQIQPEPLLGAIYFETLLNIRAQLDPLPEELQEIHNAGPAARDSLAADYARLIAPTLPEFDTIERNYIGARLFANPLAYRAAQLRSGYFIAVLTTVALRFTALTLCRREAIPLSAEILLRAAGLVDKMLLHNSQISGKFTELIEGHIQTDIRHLAQPALG